MARTAGALAVHRKGVRPGRVTAQQVGQAAGADLVDDPADRRRTRRETDAEYRDGAGTESGEGGLWGTSRPLPDRREGPGTSHHGRACHQQHAHEWVASPAGIADPPASRAESASRRVCGADAKATCSDRHRQTDGTLKHRLGRVTWEGHPFTWSFFACVAGHRHTVVLKVSRRVVQAVSVSAGARYSTRWRSGPSGTLGSSKSSAGSRFMPIRRITARERRLLTVVDATTSAGPRASKPKARHARAASVA